MLRFRHIPAAVALAFALIAASLGGAIACGACTDTCHTEITAASSAAATVTVYAAAALGAVLTWSASTTRPRLLVAVRPDDAASDPGHRPLRI